MLHSAYLCFTLILLISPCYIFSSLLVLFRIIHSICNIMDGLLWFPSYPLECPLRSYISEYIGYTFLICYVGKGCSNKKLYLKEIYKMNIKAFWLSVHMTRVFTECWRPSNSKVKGCNIIFQIESENKGSVLCCSSDTKQSWSFYWLKHGDLQNRISLRFPPPPPPSPSRNATANNFKMVVTIKKSIFISSYYAANPRHHHIYFPIIA